MSSVSGRWRLSTNKKGLSDNTPAGLSACDVTVRAGEQVSQHSDLLADEVPIAMVYNGISHAVMMATPLNLEDFGRGFSLTEGIIDRDSQLLDVEITPSPQGVEIQMRVVAEAFQQLKQRRRQLTGRTGCGLCGIDSLNAVQPCVAPVPVGQLPNANIIENALAALQTQQVLQQQCGAVHAAAYANANGKLLIVREDVGRHNALDKLIGALHGQPEPNSFFLVSSRASYEMVTKAATAGISTLVSVSAPTSMAVALAQQAHMNLIGFARPGRHVIYHHSS